MNSIRPKLDINVVGDVATTRGNDNAVLLVGLKPTNVGTSVAGELYSKLNSEEEVNNFFGKKSVLSYLYRSFRKINPETRVDILPLAETTGVGGAKASATITITGTATSAGSLEIQVLSKYNVSPTIAISSGMTAVQIATAIESTLSDSVADLPLTVSRSSGVVTLTSYQNGVELNDAYLGVWGSVAGVTVALTAFSGGTGTPTVSDALIQKIPPLVQYKHIVVSKDVDRTKFVTEMSNRFNSKNSVLVGTVCQALEQATKADVVTAISSLNNPSEVLFVSKIVNLSNAKGVSIRELSSCAIAQFTAMDTLCLTDGATITQYVDVTGGNIADATGGVALASFPYFNRKYPYLSAMPDDYNFSMAEVDDIEKYGGTVWQNNRSGLGLTTAGVVTTYKTNSAGNTDLSFKYLEYITTISEFKRLASDLFYSKFSNARIGGSTAVGNRNMINESAIKAFCLELHLIASGENYCLTRKGRAEQNAFEASLQIGIDRAKGKVTIRGSLLPVTQLRECVSTFALDFNL